MDKAVPVGKESLNYMNSTNFAKCLSFVGQVWHKSLLTSLKCLCDDAHGKARKLIITFASIFKPKKCTFSRIFNHYFNGKIGIKGIPVNSVD